MFQAPVPYDSGATVPEALAIADVNGDGKPDLLVAYQCSKDMDCQTGQLGVLLAKGDGTFHSPEIVSLLGYNPQAIAVVDVNGDGNPDVLVANNCLAPPGDGTGGLAVLLGNGDGTFQPAIQYSTGARFAWALAAGDINGDGKIDVVVSHQCPAGLDCSSGGPTVGILLGNGDGTFQPVTMFNSQGRYPVSIALLDLNGDGKLDLVMLEDGTGIAVALGNGDASFQAPVVYRSGGYSQAFAVADVNQDHKLDLVVANSLDCFDDCIAVLLGNGNGTFQPAYKVPSPDASVSVAVADVNGDGVDDLITVLPDYFASDGMGVLLGKGDGTFQPAVVFPTDGYNWVRLAVGDMNSDGRPDIATNGPTILFNNTGPHQATTTSITSSPNPSTYGQAVAFTATVSAESGTPTGTVTFLEGSYSFGSAELVNGSASLSIDRLEAGSHSLTAQYQGSLQFSVSESSPVEQVVQIAKTTATIASSLNPVKVGRRVTYSVRVQGEYGKNPSGWVTFTDAGVPLKTVGLFQGQQWFYFTYLAPGLHTIAARYEGDSNNAPSQSGTLAQAVQGPTNTVTTTSGSPALVGQPVTFTASVASQYGAIPDGELVSFYDGITLIGTSSLAAGKASYTTSVLAAGRHSIKAIYSGDTIFKTSSGIVKQVIGKYPTTTALSSTPNPSHVGQRVAFTATVQSSVPLVPTGRVIFKDGGTNIGSAPIIGGMATLNRSNLAPGTHSMTAQCSGDDNSEMSLSPPLNQEVN